jgi:hypothetical protein
VMDGMKPILKRVRKRIWPVISPLQVAPLAENEYRAGVNFLSFNIS